MADLANEVIAGPLRDWLATQRSVLNGRFRLAQRRFPRLDPTVVLGLCRELLPSLADAAPGNNELLLAVYDLLLLHAGRGTLTGQGGSQPGIGVLLRSTFPRLRPLLQAQPRQLPGALSNAVENLQGRGVEFARTIAEVAEHVSKPEDLLDAGAVLAWRLGDARLRESALGIAGRLPPRAALAALGLPHWPAEAVPLLTAGLTADGWSRPESFLSPKTLTGLVGADPKQIETLRQKLTTPAEQTMISWKLAAHLGNFLGFDGHFDEPPRLLDAGPQNRPHRFRIRCGSACFQIDGDVFGWFCQSDMRDDLPVGTAAPKEPLPALKDSTSVIVQERSVAYTTPDSFRIRILAPARSPL